MSFQPITPRSLGPAHRRARITAALNKQGKGLALGLHISAEVARGLNWHKGERVEIAIGDGAHLGWIQISRAAGPEAEGFRLVAVSPRSKDPALTVKIAGLDRFPVAVRSETHPATDCVFKIEGAAVLIELPPWFYAVERAAE